MATRARSVELVSEAAAPTKSPRKAAKPGTVLAQVMVFNPLANGALRAAQALGTALTVDFDGVTLRVRVAP